MTNKSIRSIQFLIDKVIVEYDNGLVFQFCKNCADGKHYKNFINYFCGQVDLTKVDQKLAILFEKRFFHHLSRGPFRRAFKREAHEHVEALQARLLRAGLK